MIHYAVAREQWLPVPAQPVTFKHFAFPAQPNLHDP
jgi:hypothetical protein